MIIIMQGQLVPINAALEISPHGKGSTAIYICARTFYMHTNRLIIEAVYTSVCIDLCRHCPQNLVAFELLLHQTEPWNRISPWRDFEEIRYQLSGIVSLHLYREVILWAAATHTSHGSVMAAVWLKNAVAPNWLWFKKLYFWNILGFSFHTDVMISLSFTW